MFTQISRNIENEKDAADEHQTQRYENEAFFVLHQFRPYCTPIFSA
jgi:hypothetical protein